jgi:hypothetical protein
MGLDDQRAALRGVSDMGGRVGAVSSLINTDEVISLRRQALQGRVAGRAGGFRVAGAGGLP